MDPDNYQQAWQAHSSQMRVKIYADLLFQEVQRDQQNYEAENFRAKLLAVGTVLLSLPIWFYCCAAWYMAVPVIIWVTVLELVFIRECRNRFSRHSRRLNEPGEPLLHCVKESLNQVEREIGEARHVVRWIVLPASISFLAIMAVFGLRSPGKMLSVALVDVGGVVVDLGALVVVLPGLMYFISQFGSRLRLERRQKLLSLLASLRDETQSEGGQLQFPTETGAAFVIAEPVPASAARSNSSNFQGTQPMKDKKLIEITLVVLFLAANVGSLYLFRGRFSSDPPKAHYSNFDEATKVGLEAFQKKDFDRSIAAFDDAIRLNPSHSRAHSWRGDALLNKREYDQALSEYDEAIRLDSKNAMAYCSRGATWTEKGEPDKALASFDEAIRLDATIAAMPFYKRYRGAAEALRPNPQNPKFSEEVKRGLDAFQKRDYETAATAFDEAIRCDPNHSEAHRWLGDARLNQRDYDKALSAYDQAISLDAKNAMAYCGRGIALAAKGESDKAIVAFDAAIQLDKRIADRASYKRYREAAEALREVTPDSSEK